MAQLGVSGVTITAGVIRQLGVSSVRIVAAGSRKLGISGITIRQPAALLIDPGAAQTVRAFQTVTLDASVASGSAPDSWVWSQILPAQSVRDAYFATWRVPYPVVTLSATDINGDATYRVPGVRAATNITFQIRGIKAGFPDAINAVVHTISGHGVWTYTSSAPGAPLVAVNIITR